MVVRCRWLPLDTTEIGNILSARPCHCEMQYDISRPSHIVLIALLALTPLNGRLSLQSLAPYPRYTACSMSQEAQTTQHASRYTEHRVESDEGLTTSALGAPVVLLFLGNIEPDGVVRVGGVAGASDLTFGELWACQPRSLWIEAEFECREGIDQGGMPSGGYYGCSCDPLMLECRVIALSGTR
jgi:hypothetical protein